MYPRCFHWFPGHLAPSDSHQPITGLVGEVPRDRRVVRANNKSDGGVEDAEHGDTNQTVCGRINGKSDGMEAVVFKWDHEVLSGVPFAKFAELVFHGEPGWIQNAGHMKDE